MVNGRDTIVVLWLVPLENQLRYDKTS